MCLNAWRTREYVQVATPPSQRHYFVPAWLSSSKRHPHSGYHHRRPFLTFVLLTLPPSACMMWLVVVLSAFPALASNFLLMLFQSIPLPRRPPSAKSSVASSAVGHRHHHRCRHHLRRRQRHRQGRDSLGAGCCGWRMRENGRMVVASWGSMVAPSR